MFSIDELDLYLEEIIGIDREDVNYLGYTYINNSFYIIVIIGYKITTHHISVNATENEAKDLTIKILKHVMNYLSNNG